MAEQKIEKFPENAQQAQVTFEEMMPKINYLLGALEWKNWHKEKPNVDRHVILWIKLGTLSRNFYLTHMDLQGNWDVPQGKNLTPFAWAYLHTPQVDDTSVEAATQQVLADREKALEEVKAKANQAKS